MLCYPSNPDCTKSFAKRVEIAYWLKHLFQISIVLYFVDSQNRIFELFQLNMNNEAIVTKERPFNPLKALRHKHKLYYHAKGYGREKANVNLT